VPNVPAATHALALLKVLGRQASPMPAAALARELELPRSTTYHLLKAMIAEGFVVHLPEQRRYGLGVAAFELGSAYARQEPLRWIATPALARLVQATGHNGHFALLDARDVVYVIEERAAGRPSLVTDVGVRLPAHLTASGLSILAALPPAQLRALYPSRSSLVQRDGRGPGTLAALLRELATTRSAGYAMEEGTVTPGFSSVASVVSDHRGYPVAAVALTYPADSVTTAERESLAEHTRRAAGLIARGLSAG
jgi:DNA-binding IclR family transcriptional regulator